VAFSPSLLALKEFVGLIEGQPLTVTGQIPLPADLVRNWRKALDWRKASGQARAKDVQLAAFIEFAPGILMPQGTLDLDVSASQGHFSGQLAITNAVSQPVPDVGVVRKISARIKFEGKKASLEEATGLLGGVPIVVSGTLDLGPREPATGLPYFDVQAKSDGVPLVRSAELILRAGFQTKISNAKGGPPVISGNVKLQNGYYLSDLRLLVPAPSALAADRPPYFSIEAAPFSEWRLDLNVRGDKFLKVNSPFFDGVLSASFHLGGTLRDPVALGDAKIVTGQISFPFANLNVSQGDVILTSADPYLPQLLVAASGRAYTYDLRMQVSGPADHPLVEFSSTPGLSSDQILGMLTTGELPINTGSFTTEQRAGRIGLFAGKNVLSQLGLFPGGEERLTVGSGEGFGELTFPEEVLQTYSAEFQMTRHWSLVGEYDPFGVNLGLKWLFYSK
jgi:translocation and assembly module TamB